MSGPRKAWRLLPPAMLIALALAPLAAPPLLAQEQQRKPRNLFELLFGSRDKTAVETFPERPAAQSRPRKKSTAIARQPAEPEIAIIEKLPTARSVLVVGDFMGSGIAEGLDAVFAQNPEIKVVDRTKGSSGLAREDFYDWHKEIGALIETEKPAVIVVMIGSNDRQQMRLGDAYQPLLSESWINEYRARSTALAKAIQARGVPFVWVGQLPFKPKKMLSDMLAFNDIYRQAAGNAGGTFVDIWDGFVDENGAYVANGPDINGQPVRLRSNDGINLSKAGKRKMAFYAEKWLNKILGIGGGAAAGVAPLPEAGPQPQMPVDRTLPVSLSDPELDGSGELLGRTIEAKGKAHTAAEGLVIDGIAPDPPPGRADDFQLSPQTGAAPAASESGTTSATRR